MTLANTAIAAAFPSGAPDRLARLLDAELDPLAFELGPILPLRGPKARLKPRLFIADRPDPGRWQRAVLEAFPDPGLAAFLQGAPRGVRRMIDTDGIRADVYLDDLQLHGLPQMCDVLAWPSGARSQITFISAVPDAFAVFGASRLQDAGGRLALRRGPSTIPHLLWITEARWRGTVEATEATLAGWLGLPGGYRALADAAAPLGHRIYVDALDVSLDGCIDLTVGVL